MSRRAARRKRPSPPAPAKGRLVLEYDLLDFLTNWAQHMRLPQAVKDATKPR